jgi:hypothetical protein
MDTRGSLQKRGTPVVPAETLKKRNDCTPAMQRAREIILMEMCKETDSIQSDKENRDSSCARKAICKDYNDVMSRNGITEKMVANFRNRKYQKMKLDGKPDAVTLDFSDSTMSDVTNPTFQGITDMDIDRNPEELVAVGSDGEGTASELQIGRPKGSTKESVIRKSKNIKFCKNYLAAEVKKLRDSAKGKYVTKSSTDKLVEESISKFSLSRIEVQSCLKTARSRVYHNKHSGRNLSCEHAGTKSPLQGLDLVVVEICVELAQMSHPLRPSHLVELVNSLIEGTEAAKLLEQFKLKHCKFNKLGNDKIGYAWYTAFMKRNPQLKSKKCMLLDDKRAQWATYGNIKQMYEDVYEMLVEKKLAELFPEEVLLDKDGIPCADEANAIGFRTMYKLTHPDLFFFADEVGDNTSQKNDGCRNERVIAEQHQSAQRAGDTTSDNHFTTFVITAADGTAVCCAIIVKSDAVDNEEAELSPDVISGFQPWCDLVGDSLEANPRENSKGLDKIYPYRPICKYKGHEVPTFVTCSQSASMTTEILTDILKHIDRHVPFDRSERCPFLLLDGHHSRFGLEFLTYIRNPQHKWTVCLGCPYATHLWQVGDSSEQNGAFKMAIKSEKNFVRQSKAKIQKPLTIERRDIVPMVHRAFLKSFGRMETNRKAVRERGCCI